MCQITIQFDFIFAIRYYTLTNGEYWNLTSLPITRSFQNFVSLMLNIEIWPHYRWLEAIKILFQRWWILKLDLIARDYKESKSHFNVGEYWNLTSMPIARSVQNSVLMMLNIEIEYWNLNSLLICTKIEQCNEVKLRSSLTMVKFGRGQVVTENCVLMQFVMPRISNWHPGLKVDIAYWKLVVGKQGPLHHLML